MTDQELLEIIWRAMIMIVRAFGKRYGFCVDIKIIKQEKAE
jgi:hypothetical protein